MGSISLVYKVQQRIISFIKIVVKQLFTRTFAIKLITFLLKIVMKAKNWIKAMIGMIPK
jgi:hypothetical protein